MQDAQYSNIWTIRNYAQLQQLGAPVSFENVRLTCAMQTLAECLGFSLEILPADGHKSIKAGNELFQCPSVVLRSSSSFNVTASVVTNAQEYRMVISEVRDLAELLFSQLCSELSKYSREALQKPQVLLKALDNSARFRPIVESAWGRMLRIATNVELAGGEASYLHSPLEYFFTAPGGAYGRFSVIQADKANQWMNVYLPASRRQGFEPFISRNERKAISRQRKAKRKATQVG